MMDKVIEKPVALAFRDIYLQKKSGELFVRLNNYEKTLFFEQGVLCFARTNVLHERLGEILFKMGKINVEQFSNITHVKTGKTKIGKILITLNLINERDLFAALLNQVRIIALSTFVLSLGEWKFEEKQPEIPDDSKFFVEIPYIIKEGMLRLKNIAYFKNRFMFANCKALNVSEQQIGIIGEENYQLLLYISQFPNLTMRQIFEKSGLEELTFWQKVALFYLLGIIDFEEPKAVDETAQLIEEMLGYYNEIQNEEEDLYRILKIKNDASDRELKERYISIVKKFHPDRFQDLPDSSIPAKASQLMAKINKAYDILGDPQKRREYDLNETSAIDPQKKLQQNLLLKARNNFSNARRLYEQKRFLEAAQLLEEALRYENNPKYNLLLALCQMNNPAQSKMAELNFLKAAEQDPWNPEVYAGLGLLFFNLKLYQRAETYFMKALEINSDHKLAKSKMLEIRKLTRKPSLFSSLFKRKN